MRIMKRNIFLLSMLAMLVGATSCSAGKSGTENIVLENQVTDYSLKDFTKIDASGIVKIVLKQEPTWNIRVVESNNPYLKTIVKKQGETLRIYTENKQKSSRNADSPVVYVTMPKLRSIEMAGATKMEAGDFTTDDFSLEVSGASKVTLGNIVGKTAEIDCSGASKLTVGNIDCRTAEIDCSGASNLTVSLKAKLLSIENSGASVCNLSFEGDKLKFENSGAGKVDLNVRCKELTASNSGAAKVTIKGTADKTNINATGVAKINTSQLNQY